MPRGGPRENSGRPSPWRTPGGTQTIRVPSALADQLLEIARLLDEGGDIDIDTKSKEPQKRIDLSGVKVYQFRGSREWVNLSDLVKLGYTIENVTKPEE
jgi:hypothetical protein